MDRRVSRPGPTDVVTSSSRRGFLAAAGFVSSAAALAACTEDGGPSPGNPSPSVVEYDSVPDGGTVRLSVGRIPASWNPEHPAGAVGDLETLLGPLGHTPGIVSASGDEIVADPDYIDSVELISENPQVVTVTYSPLARWEDGSSIVVNDLVSQWMAMRGEDPSFQVASTSGWEDISSIREVDRFTAEITFSRPYSSWMALLHPSLPSTGSNDGTTWNDAWTSTPIPSKGPFRITDVDPDLGTITYGRNDEWWGRPARLDEVTASVLDPAAARQAFIDGTIDLLEVATSDDLEGARSRADAVILAGPAIRWTHLTMHVQGAEGALGDAAVREAIARAIDREAIARSALEPLDVPVEVMDNLVYLPDQEAYEDSFGGLTHDPEAAGSLLDDAGWTISDGVRSRDGETLTMKVTVPDDSPSAIRRAEQISSDLRSLGIDVQVHQVSGERFFPEIIQTRDFDLTTFSWNATSEPELSSINLFSPADSAQNASGYEAPGVAEISEQLRTTTSQGDLPRLGRDLSTAQASAFTIIPLYAQPSIRALAPHIINIGGEHLPSLDWTSVGRLA